MRSKSFCPLPWIHLATRPNGDVRVCCTANASGAGKVDDKEVGLVKQDGVNMNLRDHSVEEVWNSEQMKQTRLQMLAGEVPSSCRKCFLEESNGIHSKRNWETKVWDERLDINSIIATTKDDGSLPVNIPYFDLRLGNVCQLKCVMCSPHDSSSWVKDWKTIYPAFKNEDLKKDQGWNPKFDYNWYQKSSFISTMKSQAHNIKELYFAGGEPLLIPEHYSILKFMIENGAAKDCILRYNSNGLKISSDLLSMWNEFKHVKFNFSIDAAGSKNDYIRFPSKWNDVVENLTMLDNTPDNITINLACAVQALNVSNLVELAEWKMSQNFNKINSKPFGGGVIGMHLVYLPSHLNIRTLPQEVKEQAKKKIEDFIQTMSEDEYFMNDPHGARRWQGIINYMMQEDWSHKLPAMIEYLEACDKQRGLDFRSEFNELRNL